MDAISAYILSTTLFPSSKRKRTRTYFKWMVKAEIKSRLEDPQKRTKAIMNAVIAGSYSGKNGGKFRKEGNKAIEVRIFSKRNEKETNEKSDECG
jgi:hypothetical protein